MKPVPLTFGLCVPTTATKYVPAKRFTAEIVRVEVEELREVNASWDGFKLTANGIIEVAESRMVPEKPLRLVAVIVEDAEPDPDVSVRVVGLALNAKSPTAGLGTMNVTLVE